MQKYVELVINIGIGQLRADVPGFETPVYHEEKNLQYHQILF